MWRDGFPVLSPGMARLILFSLFGNRLTHTKVFSSPELVTDPCTGSNTRSYLEATGWRGRRKLAVSFQEREWCSGCWVARCYICQFLPACLFVAKDASNCSDVAQQTRNRRVNLDFAFWFAEFSVFTSMLTFLPFMLFVWTCSSASRPSCFICLAMIFIFADTIQTLNSCSGGNLLQSLIPSFQLKQIHRNS